MKAISLLLLFALCVVFILAACGKIGDLSPVIRLVAVIAFCAAWDMFKIVNRKP